MISGIAAIAGVIGDPIAHSLSPAIHNYWLKQYNIDGAYVPFHVVPEQLEQAIKALPALSIKGINVTLPHKENVIPLLDEVTDVAQKIGAVNTITITEDGKLSGTNSDAYGFMANISEHQDLEAYKSKAIMLGAGGAAKAIAVGLLDEGWQEIVIANRTLEKAQALAETLGANVRAIAWDAIEKELSDTTLLVNTTSLGMKEQPPLELTLESLPTTSLVTDVVYQPLKTALLVEAETRGNPIVTGLGMLIHQATIGFEMWFGKAPVVDDALVNHVLKHVSS